MAGLVATKVASNGTPVLPPFSIVGEIEQFRELVLVWQIVACGAAAVERNVAKTFATGTQI